MPDAQERHVKNCGCGKSYTRAEWQGLHLAPRHGGRLTYDDGITYEFRTCAGCHSTLALTVRLPSSPPLPVVAHRKPQPSLDFAAGAMLRVPRDDK